ncbi:MAG: queuosine precursor transporter, partial [Candidatus Margulisiibacteriota bacterium]
IVDLFGYYLPAGIIVFPITYILGDVLTEVYGYGRARTVIWLGFFSNLLLVLFILVAQVLPSAPFWGNQVAFETILGYTPRLLMASFLGYLAGSFSNSFVLSKMKILTKGRWLWTRTIGSTFVGEGIDSLLFISLAFWGTSPNKVLLSMIITQWLFKTLYETMITPLTYLAVSFIKKKEKVDVFDYETNYNPLKIKI